MKNWFTFSTAIILLEFCSAISTFLLLIPFSVIFSEKPHTTSEWLQIVIGIGSPVWTFLLFFWLQQRSNHKNQRLINSLHPLNINQMGVFEVFREKLGILDGNLINNLAFHLDGDIELKDQDVNILRSPTALDTKSGKHIILPASFWARFRNHPNELAAVLLHEVGHHINKDITFTYRFQKFLNALLSVSIIYILVSLMVSINTDSPVFEPIAIYASIIGKSYLFSSTMGFLIILLIMNKLLVDWREAMADHIAIQYCGKDSLKQAEQLLFGSQWNQSRTNIKEHSDPYSPTLLWTFVSGALMLVFASKLSGTFEYIARFYLDASLSEYLKVLSLMLFQLCILLGAWYWLTIISRNTNRVSYINRLAIHAVLLITGICAGYFIYEMIPMILPSLLMPEGYDYYYRVDVTTFISTGIANEFISSAFILLITLISCWFVAKSRFPWLGFIPGTVWILLSGFEMNFFPFITHGWLSPVITIILVMSLYVFNAMEPFTWAALSKTGFVSILVLALASMADWLGYGDISFLAVINNQVAAKYERDGNLPEAIKFHEKSVRYSHHHADGWLELAVAYFENGDYNLSSNSIAKAVENLKRTPSWSDRFDTLTTATKLLLSIRNANDQAKLAAYFQQAETLWRNNSRFPKEDVASLLYNEACFHMLYNSNYSMATLYLAEAITLDQPSIAKTASQDNDLTQLELNKQPRLSPQEVQILGSLNGNFEVPNLERWIKEGKIKQETILRFVASQLYRE